MQRSFLNGATRPVSSGSSQRKQDTGAGECRERVGRTYTASPKGTFTGVDGDMPAAPAPDAGRPSSPSPDPGPSEAFPESALADANWPFLRIILRHRAPRQSTVMQAWSQSSFPPRIRSLTRHLKLAGHRTRHLDEAPRIHGPTWSVQDSKA